MRLFAFVMIACLAGTSPAPAQLQGNVRRAVFDPVLGRNAYYVTVPGNWNFEGGVIPGSGCEQNPITVFRASSPDGLTGVYLLPRVDWSWSTGQQVKDAADCMPWHAAIPARDYLTYLIGVLKVGFVKELDASEEISKSQKSLDEINAKSRPSMIFSSDSAKFLVRYDLDGHPVEEVVAATIGCNDRVFGGVNIHVHQCSAFVTRTRAPLGQWESQKQLFIAIGRSGAFDPEWNAQWNAVMAKRIGDRVAALSRPQTQMLLERGRMAQDQRMQSHRDFMNSMQRGRDLNRYRFQQGQYNKQHANDDRVDHILDCHRLQNGVSVGNCPNRQTPP